jgi:hypothetical protein
VKDDKGREETRASSPRPEQPTILPTGYTHVSGLDSTRLLEGLDMLLGARKLDSNIVSGDGAEAAAGSSLFRPLPPAPLM